MNSRLSVADPGEGHRDGGGAEGDGFGLASSGAITMKFDQKALVHTRYCPAVTNHSGRARGIQPKFISFVM
jgi:hypothetical protein